MQEFFLTQTSIKDLERDETCPWRWKKQWLDREIPFKSSEDMDKGSYFEQIVLGAGAIAGSSITDLPRLKNGEKSADHQRIDAQAERAKRILTDKEDPEYLGFTIVKTQLEIRVGNKKGTYDIEAVDSDNHPWVLDLKLTKDLTSDRTKYGWGNNWEDLDLLQMAHYQDLYYEWNGVRPKMGLLVFDYSPQKRIMFGEIVVSEEKRNEKTIRFNAAEEAIGLYEKHGWVKIPNVKECENCPLKCDVRQYGSKIIKKVINY